MNFSITGGTITRLEALAARRKIDVSEEVRLAVALWLMLRENGTTEIVTRNGARLRAVNLGAVDQL